MTATQAMVLLEQTIVSVALPSMQRDLDTSRSEVHWVVNAYLLALAATVATGGRLGDSLGRVKTLLGGLALFAAASLVCGAAPTAGVLIAARAVQGIGAALMQPASIVIIVSAVEPRQRGRAVSLVGGVGSLFLALGPLLGGMFTEYLSWRWVFWINLPIAASTAGLLWLAQPPDPTQPGQKLNPLSLVLLIVGSCGLTFGLQESHEWGWTSPAILTALGGGIGLLALFAWIQLRAVEPLIDLRLFGQRTFSADAGILLCNQAVLMVLVVYSALYLQAVLGFAPAGAGVVLLPLVVPMAIGIETTGWLFDRYGVKVPAVLGCALAGAGIIWQAVVLPLQSYTWLVPGLALYGLGRGFVFTPAFTDALNRVPSALRGQAYGLLFTLRQMGAALGLAGIGSWINHEQRRRAEEGAMAAPEALAGSIADGYWIAAGIVLVGLLVAVLFLEPVRSRRHVITTEERR